jgi:hypothetical protein
MKSLLILALTVVILLLVGIWAFSSGLKNLLPGIASRTWPSTTGHVTSQAVEAYEVSTEDGTYTRYRPAVNYEFDVYDHTYQGSRVRIGDPGFDQATDASQLLAKLTGDSECQVFYDPYDPNNCTLLKGLGFTTLAETVLALVGGLMFSACGGFLTFHLVRNANWRKFLDIASHHPSDQS